MARHRALTLLALTSLALTSLLALMVTFNRLSSSFGEPNAIRLMISQKKFIEYQQRLRLIASENNSNKTLNNLFDTLIQPVKSEPQVVANDLKQVLKNKESKHEPAELKSKSEEPSKLISLVPKESLSVINAVPLKVGPAYGYGQKLNSSKEHSLLKSPSTELPLVQKNESLLTEAVIKQERSDPNQKSDKALIPTSSTAKSDIQLKEDIGIDPDQKSVQSNQKLQQLDSIENSVDTKERAQEVVKLKPKLVFDAQDLKTTESMRIDKPLGCDDDLGASLDLLVIVNSAVNHFEARRAIRQTWGRLAVERGAYLFFLIGSTNDQSVQDLVLLEEQENQDLLQGHFIDNYFNLTLKTISMMKWISDHCYKVKYVLKVDDDMFVNMQHITDFSETRYFNKCIIGKLAKKWKPHRDPRNKWYVPANAFNGTLFPTFATGPAYIVSGDAVRPLYQWSIKLNPIYLEDVYMTGIVAEKARIRRLSHAMMTNVHIKNINPCNYPKFMTSHKHSPQDIELLWQQVYAQPQKPCPVPTVRPTKALNKPVVKSIPPSKKPPATGDHS